MPLNRHLQRFVNWITRRPPLDDTTLKTAQAETSSQNQGDADDSDTHPASVTTTTTTSTSTTSPAYTETVTSTTTRTETRSSDPAYFEQLTDLEKEIFNRSIELIRQPHAPPHKPTEAERHGMRSYLQRAETRLSTYQRVAGVFLNGAGLLVLLPGLVRENSLSVLKISLSDSSYGHFLSVIWLVAVCLPIYAFYFLVKDLVQFYFTPTFFGADDIIPTTRFSLGGLTFPSDESPEVKARTIAHHVHNGGSVSFGLGGASAESLISTYKESHAGRLSSNLRNALMHHFSQKTDMTPLEKISTAYSISGSLDLSLTDEVTRVEMSLARHGLQLRRLVLRYAKALILFITTTIFLVVAAIPTNGTTNIVCCHTETVEAAAGTAAASPALNDERVFIVLLLSVIWSLVSMYTVRLPVQWIDKLANIHFSNSRDWPCDPTTSKKKSSFTDPDLKKFERAVIIALAVTCLYSLILMGIVVHWNPGELWSTLVRILRT